MHNQVKAPMDFNVMMVEAAGPKWQFRISRADRTSDQWAVLRWPTCMHYLPTVAEQLVEVNGELPNGTFTWSPVLALSPRYSRRLLSETQARLLCSMFG